MVFGDYSAGRIRGSSLAAAGFAGVIRYVGVGGGASLPGKRLTASEYQDLIRSGRTVYLVVEQSTEDAWQGYGYGVQLAQAGLNDARALGIPEDKIFIAAAADRHALNQGEINAAVDYARAFRDVVGYSRAGFYGFNETLNAVKAANIVSWFWRCGSQPSLEERKWVNFWQRNVAPTTKLVDGVLVDWNEEYAPMPNHSAAVQSRKDFLDMSDKWEAGEDMHDTIPCAGRPQFWYLFPTYGETVYVHQVDYVMPTDDPQRFTIVHFDDGSLDSNGFHGVNANTWKFESDKFGPVPVPTRSGTPQNIQIPGDAQPVGISIRYSAAKPFRAYCG